jgi:Na+-driven multidrug efflux pump
VITLFLIVFPEIYNIAMLANYGGTVVVAGAGLGVMFINMFVYGTFEGLNGAIDTLVSQTYGAKDYAG